MDTRDIAITADQVRRIVDLSQCVDPEDADLLHDMLEGSTDLPELLSRLAEAEAEASMMVEALKARKAEIGQREARMKARKDAFRAGAMALLDAAKLRKWELPEATISVSERRSIKAQSDMNPDLLPDDCVKVERKPVAAAIKEAIEAGRNIPGYALEKARSVTIRRK